MIDKQTMDDVHILYICSYGQTGLPICVDLEHRYCKLKSQKSKKCNLRPVVSYKDYKRKEQECEELNKQVEILNEKCQQLAQLKEENDRLRKRIVTIFDCLIKANRDVIVDTLWVDKMTTLWDYIAQTLGIEGDQNQIEEQVKMLYSEGE